MRAGWGAGLARGRGVAGLCAVLLLAAVGCAPPKAIRTYEFVTAYDRMTEEYDPLVSLVYLPEGVSLADYRAVVVGDFAAGVGWVEDREVAEAYGDFFRLVLKSELQQLDRFDVVTLRRDDPALNLVAADDVIEVEGMVTRFDFGCGWKRYFSFYLFFLDGGATDLQIEGRIRELGSHRLVAEFVDRRRHLANTPFGPNPHTFKDAFAMKVTAHATAECFASFLADRCEDCLPVTSAALAAADRAPET
jgi:hypothetical protein